MKKRAGALLLTVLLAFSTVFTATEPAQAAGAVSNLVLGETTMQSVQIPAGGTRHVSVLVKLRDGYIVNPQIFVTSADGESLTFSNVKISDPDNPDSPYVFLSDTAQALLEYDIKADDYAKIGTYKYYITYTAVTSEEGAAEPGELEMQAVVISEKVPPQISVISETEFSAEAGENVTMTFTVRNEGELKALNTYLSVGYDDGIMIPSYAPLNQKIGDIAARGTKQVTVSYTINEDVKTQRVKLPITVVYKNEKGENFTASDYALYLDIKGVGSESDGTESSTLLLNTVSQSPAQPVAGGDITVSFHLENVGNKDITDVKVSATGLSAAGFEPINSEPYQYIGTIPGNSRKKVDVSLKVGKEIAEGLNTLTIQYTYTDGNGVQRSESTSLYILDVKNPKNDEVVISRPKLMVSNFFTDVEEVKAGGIFDFTFNIKNTNADINAKNIKVTVTSSSGTFSVTAGSNSFFVDQIKAGDTAAITVNLKASAAVTTGAYPINIKMEYEYDGMVATATYDGEVVNEEILLQVKENLRPSVENVSVGGWNSPIVNQTTTMNFEFYNMGKSILNNTYVTVEGDFMLANGSNSYYIGNISAGMPEYVEFDVIPLVEGTASGKMIIHMEDSNGDEVTLEKDFSAYIQGETSWDNPGGDVIFEDPSIPADNNQVVKEPILPLWMFLCIQAAILVIVIPVTRKIRLTIYRNKIRKEDEQ